VSQPRSRAVELDGPVNLRATLGVGHGPRDPTTWFEDDASWRATRTSAGPATLCVRVEGRRAIGEAWGDGADAVLDNLPELLGAHDDPDAFEAKHDVVAMAKRAHPGLRIGRGRPAMEVLLPTILGQRVKGTEAASAYRKMVFDLGEPAPGPKKLTMPPTARTLSRVPLYALHRYGVERSRGVALLEAAHHPRFVERIHQLEPAAAIEHLCKLPGVGPWTANLTVAGALGWTDAVPVGDYHIPNMVAWALAGEPRADDVRMLALLEPYRGQRWRVVRLLSAQNVHAPKYGPRRASFETYVELGSRKHDRGRSRKR
jgi:3-methyladenine DNA glycosylase/8-oxoguanine DNA glycosylase